MPDNNDELKKYLDYDGLAYLLQRFPKTTVHCIFDDEFAGETATLTHGTTTYTKTVPATSPYELTFAVNELGTWTLQSSYLGTQYSDTVDITYLGQKGEIELTIVPDGSTIEPVNSISTWLKCANLNKSYTTLAEVLADTETYETLLADSNACQYMKRSTGWAYKGLVPKMSSDTTPSGVCTIGGTNTNAYMTFDRDKNSYGDVGYGGLGTVANSWFQYKFESAVTVKFFDISQLYHSQGFWGKTFKVQYSNDGTNFTDITSSSFDMSEGASTTGVFTKRFSLDEDITATYFRIQYLTSNNSYKVLVGDIQFYSDVDITTNQDAMARLGKFDYASNLLLSDSTWCGAILNSDYFESVCNYNVPAMTSNTAPEGEASASSVHSNQYAYMAFDRAMNHGWHSGAGANQWLQYRFVKPIVLKKVKLGSMNAGGPKVTMVQGSNDGSTWSDIGSFQDCPTAGVYYINNYADNNTAYTYIRLAFSASNYIVSNQHYYANIIAQFWGRATEEVLVPLVPTMTSATTPSGEVITSGSPSGYDAWKAFDNNDTTEAAVEAGANGYIGYRFANPTRVNAFRIYDNNTKRLLTFKIQASNTGETNDWIDISDVMTMPSSYDYTAEVRKNGILNTESYYYYRVLQVTTSFSANIAYKTIQFYAKTVQTNIIHSTPNDTIYMLEDGDPIVLATTNSDGDGILDFSQLSAGPVTLYSSVAKNPEDLTADYSKTITINKTQYGGTTEAYLMPDTVKTLYWWGYVGDNLEDASNANGWSRTQYTLRGMTHNTNDLLSYPQAGYYISAIGIKNQVSASKFHAISIGIRMVGGEYGDMRTTSTKAIDTPSSRVSLDSTIMAHFEESVSIVGYTCITSWSDAQIRIYAFWYE